MTNPRFDPSLPFGEIHPPVPGGGVYEQDGDVFDATHKFLFRHETAGKRGAGKPAGGRQLSVMEQVAKMSPGEKAALLKALGGEPAAAQPVPGQLAKQHGGPERVEPTGETNIPDGEDIPTDETITIDVAKWLRGEENYPWFALRAVVAKGYPGVDTTSIATVVDGLTKLDIVPESEIKRAKGA
jgi:hypothetical protein